jgi:hypothetical protein
MEKTLEERQMRALWFARTLDANKQHIKAGKGPMPKENYDKEWERIQLAFKEKKEHLSIH